MWCSRGQTLSELRERTRVDVGIELPSEQRVAGARRGDVFAQQRSWMASILGPDHEAQRVANHLVLIGKARAEQDGLEEEFVGGKRVLVIATKVRVLANEGEHMIGGDATHVPPLRPSVRTEVAGVASRGLQRPPHAQEPIEGGAAPAQEARVLTTRDAGLAAASDRVAVEVGPVPAPKAPLRHGQREMLDVAGRIRLLRKGDQSVR